MSTFLQLCQDVRREAGLSGTGPASVKGQTGMDDKIVNWVRNSWIDIQDTKSNWRFMWKGDGHINCIANQREYDPTALGFDIRAINPGTTKCYINSVGSQMWLTQLDYAEFRNRHLVGPLIYGRPIVMAWTPDNKIVVHPIPNDAYQIDFEYYRTPQVLTENTDVPIMPERLHQVIVFHALNKYAVHDEAMGVAQDSMFNLRRWMTKLNAEQSPMMPVRGSL